MAESDSHKSNMEIGEYLLRIKGEVSELGERVGSIGREIDEVRGEFEHYKGNKAESNASLTEPKAQEGERDSDVELINFDGEEIGSVKLENQKEAPSGDFFLEVSELAEEGGYIGKAMDELSVEFEHHDEKRAESNSASTKSKAQEGWQDSEVELADFGSGEIESVELAIQEGWQDSDAELTDVELADFGSGKINSTNPKAQEEVFNNGGFFSNLFAPTTKDATNELNGELCSVLGASSVIYSSADKLCKMSEALDLKYSEIEALLASVERMSTGLYELGAELNYTGNNLVDIVEEQSIFTGSCEGWI